MESLLIGLRIMALLTLARWLTPSTVTLSSWAKGLGALTLAYTPIHALVFWLLREPGDVATCLTHNLWENLNHTINAYLSSVTLAGLLAQQQPDKNTQIVKITHIY